MDKLVEMMIFGSYYVQKSSHRIPLYSSENKITCLYLYFDAYNTNIRLDFRLDCIFLFNMLFYYRY